MMDETLKKGELEELTKFMIDKIILQMLGYIVDKNTVQFNENFKTLIKLGLESEVITMMLMTKGLDLKNGSDLYEEIYRRDTRKANLQ